MAPIYVSAMSGLATKVIPVDKLTFDVVNASAELSGYDLEKGIITREPESEGETVLPLEVSEFLNLPTTKVFVVQTEGEPDKLVAVNLLSQEVIEISKLGNHISALNYVIDGAIKKLGELQNNKTSSILDHDFITGLHYVMFKNRAEFEEKGYGAYRDVLYNGQPNNVRIGHWERQEDGNYFIYNKYWQPPYGGEGKIKAHMQKLLDWVNGTEPYHVLDETYTKCNREGKERWIDFPAFADLSPLERAVRFHVECIRIQPFSDGNHRTARMLMQYLLILQNEPLVNIHKGDQQAYKDAIDIAIATGNFEPMMKIAENSRVADASELYAQTMKFYSADNKEYHNNKARRVKKKDRKKQPTENQPGDAE